MKIYIATPVNGRKEKTLEEKREAAHKRVQAIAKALKERWKVFEEEYHSSFDEDIRYIVGEEKIMGCCIQKVMGCDSIFLDYYWESSKGCQLEKAAAEIYHKQIWYADDMKILPPDRYLTDEETAGIRNCLTCKNCLPPFYRENGKMCKLDECHFEEA